MFLLSAIMSIGTDASGVLQGTMSVPYSSTPTEIHNDSIPVETGRYIASRKLIRPADRVLCMVSGGADSTAMLHVLCELASGRVDSLRGGFSLGICHVNYGTRGSDSEEDEIFVRHLGDRLSVQVHTIRAPVAERSNFQAWARDFRYLAARNLCRWQGYTKIAVAHNRDDRIETFLYRLVTYSGRRSLVVMPSRKGRVIRPLLFLNGAEIRDYCAATGIDFREDKSNQSLEYRRNRLRHQVMPGLAEVRPDFRDRIEETIMMLEDEQAALDSLTDMAWQEVLTPQGEAESGEAAVLSATSLTLLDRAVARLVVRRWLAAADITERITRRLLDAIVDLASGSSGTRRLSLPCGLVVERRYDLMSLVPGEPDSDEAPEPVGLPVPGYVRFGDYHIEAQHLPDPGQVTGDHMTAEIDADKVRGPLTVRAWRSGDRIRPLGMEGTKSLQDLFTDEKIPEPERGRLAIVCCDDAIVWVCGVRLSEDFRVTSRSRQAIRLTAVRREIENAV